MRPPRCFHQLVIHSQVRNTLLSLLFRRASFHLSRDCRKLLRSHSTRLNRIFYSLFCCEGFPFENRRDLAESDSGKLSSAFVSPQAASINVRHFSSEVLLASSCFAERDLKRLRLRCTNEAPSANHGVRKVSRSSWIYPTSMTV